MAQRGRSQRFSEQRVLREVLGAVSPKWSHRKGKPARTAALAYPPVAAPAIEMDSAGLNRDGSCPCWDSDCTLCAGWLPVRSGQSFSLTLFLSVFNLMF